MNNYDHIMGLLRTEESFAFVRFNDGEMMGIEAEGAIVARGQQVVDKSLRLKLIDALQHRQHNYWLGKPCSTCWPNHRKLYNAYVESDYKYQTYAVVMCNNGHWKKFIHDFTIVHNDRPVVWIGGEDQDTDKLKDVFDMNIVETISTQNHNAWVDYDRIRPLIDGFPSNGIIMASCGPMSRVLIHEWFSYRQDCTFLDIGSTFDPFTKNVMLRCHNGTLKYCKECHFEK